MWFYVVFIDILKNIFIIEDMIKVDIHTHSIASGHGTLDRISDMAAEASLRGMSILGFSEHGPKTLGSATLSYFCGLKQLEREKDGVMLRYGAECNILDTNGTLDLPDYILEGLDYVIASIHPQNIKELCKNDAMRAYAGAMKNPYVRFIGHPDDDRYPLDYEAFVHQCLENECLPELNEISLSPNSYRKGGRRNATELLKQCMALSCPILISSDSHGKAGIGLVPEAEKLLEELSFPENLIINNLI